MKRLQLFLLAALLFSSATFSQSMTVWKGHVSYVYPLVALQSMTYGVIEDEDGAGNPVSAYTLDILGYDFLTDEIDSITVSPDPDFYSEYVEVTYDGTEAFVVVPGALADYLNVNVGGANVSVYAADDLAEEVTYRLTGSSSDGSFMQQGSYKTTLILDNLTLTSTSGAAVSIQNGKRIAVQLPEGTTTTLADASDGAQKACFFIKGHAELSGAGTLNLVGNTKHAYASNEYTLLAQDFGTINVGSAVSDGLHIDQYFQMDGGKVDISGVGGDGIDVAVTDDDTDEQNGQVLLLGGSVTIDTGAAEDVKGIKSEADFTITDAIVNIKGTGDGVKGIKAAGNLYVGGTTTAVTIVEEGTTFHKDQEDESKTRGIKVDGDFTFDGGTISVSTPGKKAKPIAVDGTYYYKSGTIDCTVDATNVG